MLYGALLTPQGKVIADMFLWSENDTSVLLELDVTRTGDIHRRLSMYKLRANVAVESVSIAALWDTGAFGRDTPDPRFPDFELGWRDAPSFPLEAFNFESGAGHFEARRIALGVPDLARDAAPEEVFALEALLEELHGVDFQKGCFVGQENVSRMKRRATTRRKFCPVAFEGEAPAFGTPIRAGEAELGSVRSGIDGRAIALLRLDRALDAIDKGEQLFAGDRTVRLDPPEWLIMPPRGP